MSKLSGAVKKWWKVGEIQCVIQPKQWCIQIEAKLYHIQVKGQIKYIYKHDLSLVDKKVVYLIKKYRKNVQMNFPTNLSVFCILRLSWRAACRQRGQPFAQNTTEQQQGQGGRFQDQTQRDVWRCCQQYCGASSAVGRPLLLSLRRLVPQSGRHRLRSWRSASPGGGTTGDHRFWRANHNPSGAAARRKRVDLNVRAQHTAGDVAPVALPCVQPRLRDSTQELAHHTFIIPLKEQDDWLGFFLIDTLLQINKHL